jgi:hypothetical protein
MNSEVVLERIRESIVSDVLNLYRDTMRSTRNPNRHFRFLSSRYYNDPPAGGYQINEEHEYILPDNDDITSAVLLEVVTSFGSPETESYLKNIRRNQIKNIGKYKKIKKDDPLKETDCPICIESFKENEFYRKLDCGHCFHKRCIDRWFRKDHSECPMCRKKILE